MANLVSERWEASDLDLEGHLAVIQTHAAGRIVDAVLVHEGPIDPATRARYEAEGAAPLGIDAETHGPAVLRRDLLGPGPQAETRPGSHGRGAARGLASACHIRPTVNTPWMAGRSPPPPFSLIFKASELACPTAGT